MTLRTWKRLHCFYNASITLFCISHTALVAPCILSFSIRPIATQPLALFTLCVLLPWIHMPHNVTSLRMYRRTAALQHYGLPTPRHRSVGTLSMTALPLPPVTSPPRRCCIAASTQRSPARPPHSRTLHRCSLCIAITARCQTSSDSLLTRRPSQSLPL